MAAPHRRMEAVTQDQRRLATLVLLVLMHCTCLPGLRCQCLRSPPLQTRVKMQLTRRWLLPAMRMRKTRGGSFTRLPPSQGRTLLKVIATPHQCLRWRICRLHNPSLRSSRSPHRPRASTMRAQTSQQASPSEPNSVPGPPIGEQKREPRRAEGEPKASQKASPG